MRSRPMGGGPKPRKSGAPKGGAQKGGAQKGGAPKGGAPKGWGPEGWEAQNFALFLPFPATVSLFLCLSGGLLVEFWWCLKRRVCTFGVLGLSCASPGGQARLPLVLGPSDPGTVGRGSRGGGGGEGGGPHLIR